MIFCHLICFLMQTNRQGNTIIVSLKCFPLSTMLAHSQSCTRFGFLILQSLKHPVLCASGSCVTILSSSLVFRQVLFNEHLLTPWNYILIKFVREEIKTNLFIFIFHNNTYIFAKNKSQSLFYVHEFY